MKTPIPAPLLGALLLLTALAYPARAQSRILPKGWIATEPLEQAEANLQKQLDTGVDMTGTAWDMAAVKNAELLVLYISLFEKLSEPARAALLKEQEAWLKQRRRAVVKAGDGQGGTMGQVLSASQDQDWTEKRIAELKKRLEKR